jgi:hypothetical protein
MEGKKPANSSGISRTTYIAQECRICWYEEMECLYRFLSKANVISLNENFLNIIPAISK